MHRENRTCARCYQVANLARVDVMRLRIDIAKHRSDLLPLQSVRSSDERERWDNDFTCYFQCARRNFERDRRVAHRDAMFYSDELSHALLEFLNERPCVCQPFTIQHFIEARE